MSHRKLLHGLQTAADNPLSVMETRPRRQQTTEKIGTPLDLGFGTVHIERRNGSPVQKGAAMVTRCFWKATGVLATAVVVATVSVVTAQSSLTTPTRANASSDELLTEVRGLRGDLQQAAKISIRAQLLVARLQLQEQRINVVGGQLTEIRRLIAIKESAQIPFAERLKGFDEALRSASISAEQYKDIESQIRLVKAQIAQMQKEARELRAQDAELSNQLTTEQGRWSDFNSRLDDLERMLPASQR